MEDLPALRVYNIYLKDETYSIHDMMMLYRICRRSKNSSSELIKLGISLLRLMFTGNYISFIVCLFVVLRVA